MRNAECGMRIADDKRRGRLNLIRHLLRSVPYMEMRREKVILPKRKTAADRTDRSRELNFIDEIF